MLPNYPVADRDRGLQMMQQLGSFWTNVFNEPEVLQAHLQSTANADGQTYLNFLEAVAVVSRFTVPVFHNENWFLLTIKLSDALGLSSVYKPDDLQYGQQDGSVEGRPSGFIQKYGGTDFPGRIQVKLPAGLVDLPFNLQNAVLVPSRILMNDLDYDIDTSRGVLRFRTDPFKDTSIPKRELFSDAGEKVDEEIALWAYRGQFDWTYLQTHFGYALGLALESTENHKKILNAYWDMHVLGMTLSSTQLILSALAGVPTVIEATETVEVVSTESTSKLIVTNAHVYRVPLGAAVLVSVGQTVHAGDSLCDAIRIAELSGHSPDYSLLPAMSMSPSFLSGGYVGELSFHDRLVSLDYKGTDSEGRAIVQFEVSGFPGDVEKFWNDLHERGVAEGQTLANLLDLRDEPETEPIAQNLPAQINPLRFVLDNILRNNLFVVRVRQASFFPGAPGLQFFSLLRGVIPPHTTYIVFVELSTEDSIDLSQAGGEDEAGVTEATAKFKAKGPIIDQLFELSGSPGGDVATYVDAHVSARLVSLTCQ